MRDLYVRHRKGCKKAQKSRKGRPARQVFGCGCPIYARYEIRDLVTGSTLESYNGSLKGITTKEAAEEYLDNRFANVRAGQLRANTKAMTVSEAIETFIEEKKATLPPVAEVQVSEHVERVFKRLGKDPNDREREIIVKHRTLLGALQAFCEERGVKYITEVTDEHLRAFQQTWKGRVAVDPATKEKVQAEASQVTKQKNQEFIRAFFKRAAALGWIQANPTVRLLPIKSAKPKPKPFTKEQRERIFALIPEVHPKEVEAVRAFLYMQMFAAPRIADVVQLEIANLMDDGIFLRQQKTDQDVFLALPPFAIASLRKLTSKSERFFF